MIKEILGFILIGLLVFGIGFGCGVAYGTKQSIEFMTDFGFYFLEKQNITFNISQEAITDALIKYQTKIDMYVNK